MSKVWFSLNSGEVHNNPFTADCFSYYNKTCTFAHQSVSKIRVSYLAESRYRKYMSNLNFSQQWIGRLLFSSIRCYVFWEIHTTQNSFLIEDCCVICNHLMIMNKNISLQGFNTLQLDASEKVSLYCRMQEICDCRKMYSCDMEFVRAGETVIFDFTGLTQKYSKLTSYKHWLCISNTNYVSD
jgi:hypothetical protein